jgi:para-nitrobenzyl esterase
MRAKPATDVARVPGASLIRNPGDRAWFYTTVDGEVLPTRPLDQVRAGHHNAVPVVLGTTAKEYAHMIDQAVPEPTPDDATYRSQITAGYGASIGAQVLAHYPSSDYATPRDAFVMVLSDALMTCPTRRLARALSAAHPAVFRYYYTHVFVGKLQRWGAAHGFDLALVFHDLWYTGSSEAALADRMGGIWTRFAITGDPNGGDVPLWPRYDTSDPTMILDSAMSVVDDVRSSQCDFWDTIDDT